MIAIDCDLRKSYGVSVRGSAKLTATGDDPRQVIGHLPITMGETILFEIASPLDYTDSKAIAYNKRRWTIWNVAQAVLLQEWNAYAKVLVAPSHKWTQGFALDVRHKMAGATLKKKDLRECEAMLFFYAAKPADWVPLSEFLARL
jgi:hypothetical protein